MAMAMPKYVFTLMLENRSFDHMLGLSGISGNDLNAAPTTINGLSGDPAQYANQYNGTTYTAGGGAPLCMPVGPAHDFKDVYEQLAGPDQVPQPSNNFVYPTPQNTGFVANYAKQIAKHNATGADPGDVMKCFVSQDTLPVLHALASEFVVCDNWFSSMPGPTWPNRFFAHAASSGGLDHSPGPLSMGDGYAFEPFKFQHGTIFQRLQRQNLYWAVLSGFWLPQSFAMDGMRDYWHSDRLRFMDDFDALLTTLGQQQSGGYVFIEPDYGDIINDTYRCGTSQHAVDDVTRGEWLLKLVYEKLRNSPLWTQSALIITWDEHGGFYDHVPPPPGRSPGDQTTNDDNNQYGFKFDRLGVRVPALVVSPLTDRNLIDHRQHDHATILSTLEAVFNLGGGLTDRDSQEFAAIATLAMLFTLDSARSDCPPSLPNPIPSTALPDCKTLTSTNDLYGTNAKVQANQAPSPLAATSLPSETLAGFTHVAHLLDATLTDMTDPAQAQQRKQAYQDSVKTSSASVQSFMADVQDRLAQRGQPIRSS
jgi:phospholipase C